MFNLLKTFESFNKEQALKMSETGDTYLKRFPKIYDYNNIRYNDLVSELKSYEFNDFFYKQTPYGIFITPDLRYINLYKELCSLSDQIFNPDINFYITLTGIQNLIDFDQGIPIILKGTSLGYKLYKLIIDKNQFISSNRYSSYEAYNLWYNLIQDDDLYAITSKQISVLIKKDISDIDLNKILGLFNLDELILDDELIERIG